MLTSFCRFTEKFNVIVVIGPLDIFHVAAG